MSALVEDELSQKLSPIFRKYHIQKAILCSSRARDNAPRRSDGELILIQNTVNRFFDRYQGVLHEIGMQVKQPDVDVFIYTPQELQEIANKPFIARALEEGKVIFEV